MEKISFSGDILQRALKIYPGEETRVGIMMLYSLVVVGGIVITGQVISTSIFLSSLPKSAIPFKFIVPPLALFGAILIYTKMASRFRIDRLIKGTFSLVLVVLILFRILLSTPLRDNFALMLVIFVTFDVVSKVVMIQFWVFAGELFNPQEAKRVFSLITGGGTAASILFGAFLSSVAGSVAPDNLIFVMILSVILSFFCVGHLSKEHLPPFVPYDDMLKRQKTSDKKDHLIDDVKEVMSSPLLATMSFMVIIAGAIGVLADYQVDIALKNAYGSDGNGMVGFLAVFLFIAGTVAGLFQLFLAGRFMEKFGLLPSLIGLPFIIVLGSFAILFTGGFLWAVLIPRFGNQVLGYTVYRPGENILYMPVPLKLRAKAKAILSGIITPPVMGMVGVVFWVVSQRGDTSLLTWTPVMLMLAIIWIFLLTKVSGKYVNALSESIVQRHLDIDKKTVNLTDETSIRVLRQALSDSDPLRVLHVLSLISQISSVDWTPQVIPLLKDKSPEVKIEALAYLKNGDNESKVAKIKELFKDDDHLVREAAISAVCKLSGKKGIRDVIPFLADDNPRTCSVAIVSLIKHCGLGGFLHAGESLKLLLESENPEKRKEAARILGELQVESFYAPLLEMMDDPDIDVRISAIRAATKIRTPDFIPGLLRMLSHPVAKSYAAEAILECARDNIDMLESILNDFTQESSLRVELARILEKHATPKAVKILITRTDDHDDEVRTTIYNALANLVKAGYRSDLDKRYLGERLRKELRNIYRLRVLLFDLEEFDPDNILLYEIIEKRISRNHERILALLSLKYPYLPIESVSQALKRENGRLRGNAVELIDNLVSSKIKELLIPFLGSVNDQIKHIASKELGIKSGDLQKQLSILAGDDDAWTRACALYSIGVHKLDDLLPVAEKCQSSKNILVREMADFAIAKIKQTT